jgi:hypothetical protein
MAGGSSTSAFSKSEEHMNDAYREIKGRVRRLDELLRQGGLQNLEFAQALNRARQLVRKGDRSREPSVELRTSVDRAETLGRSLG